MTCVPVHRDQLRAQRLITSMGSLFFLNLQQHWMDTVFVCISIVKHICYFFLVQLKVFLDALHAHNA